MSSTTRAKMRTPYVPRTAHVTFGRRNSSTRPWKTDAPWYTKWRCRKKKQRCRAKKRKSATKANLLLLSKWKRKPKQRSFPKKAKHQRQRKPRQTKRRYLQKNPSQNQRQRNKSLLPHHAYPSAKTARSSTNKPLPKILSALSLRNLVTSLPPRILPNVPLRQRRRLLNVPTKNLTKLKSRTKWWRRPRPCVPQS